MTRYVKMEEGNSWSITPILRFVERINYDPVGAPHKILQQKYVRLDPYHHSPDGTEKWVDVPMEKEEEEEEEEKIELSWKEIEKAVLLNTNQCVSVGDSIHDMEEMKKHLGFE